MLSLISDGDIYRYICRSTEKKEEGIVMKRRCIAVLLFFCLLIPGVSTPVFAEAVEQDMYPDELWKSGTEQYSCFPTLPLSVNRFRRTFRMSAGKTVRFAAG